MVQSSTTMRKVGHQLLNWAAVIVLVLSVIIFTIIRGNAFFSVNNLTSILTSMSTVTIFAMAATVSMAPDGFDMSAATLGTVIHLIGGILGILTMLALGYLGSTELLTPTNVLLYQLIWMIPGFLVTEWTRAV